MLKLVLSLAFLVVVSSPSPSHAVEFSLLKPSHFKLVKGTKDFWIIPEIQKAFFSKIRVTEEGYAAVVPTVTLHFQTSIVNPAPPQVMKIRLPDEKGKLRDIVVTQRTFQGTWALSYLPADLTMDLLDAQNKVVGIYKLQVQSMPGIIAVNKQCLDTKLGLMDPTYAPAEALFLACDPTPEITLVVASASGRKLTWEPEDTEDQAPLPHIAHLSTTAPSLSFRLEKKKDEQPERFQLIFRGLNAAKEYAPAKHELEMELGVFSAAVTQTLLPQGYGQMPVGNAITQKGVRGRLAGISHLRHNVVDLEGAIFSTLLPIFKDRSGPTTWIWGAEVLGKFRLPFEPGRWTSHAGLGARYENISRTGADSLNHLFGPLVLLELGYTRAHHPDYFYYQSAFSLEQPLGRDYFGNQHRWAHTLGFIARSGPHYAWGFRAQYESYNVGNDAMGFEVGVFSLGSLLRF